MNREIKFRAWDEVSEKMLNWNYFLDTNMKNTFIAPESTGIILMQYTGLDDKNGKEIYEGDIAKYENMIGKIMFFNGSFILSDFEETEEWELGVINEELEIMGDIYNNPELLEGE
nr:MAG TPA: YopX protein [Caudoviricetes sp.]